MRQEDEPTRPRVEVGPLQLEWEAERERVRPRVLRQIEDAFHDVTLAGGRSLHQARALDDYKPATEVDAARALDPERGWHEVLDDKVERLWDTLGFLDAKGFKFYLPRFMTYVLRHEQRAHHTSHILFWLEPKNVGDLAALLTDEQRAAVAAFVEFFSEGR